MWYEVDTKWTGSIMLKWWVDYIKSSASESSSCQLIVLNERMFVCEKSLSMKTTKTIKK